MMNRVSIIFCIVSLIVTAVVLGAGFNLAAMPRQTVAAAKKPVPPESLPDIDMPGFGKVSVLDLVGYYIENPPAIATAAGGAATSTKRFGGC
ncbi:hypothetical protein [Sulfuricella sp.]|uniref:hypothetical protein n=1 Tax=Sulfuricella sp. TaxID=2099377 RepID=UPI002C3C1769|nr:hypothetical protein [Sulfuricella sp.]HUX62271.1 hypothetical protein [Sulfuricella sp.]